MIKKGISGGLLSIVSLIDSNERTAVANNAMIRTSSLIREAAKIGLQSLYANADEVMEKYKDFDLIKAMKARNGAKLLWVRARSIDADICNSNGDYFSEEQLTAEVDCQGKKMPAYKTFEGVPIYTNHKNDNIEEAKGMVVYAEWDDVEKCVYCVFFIDEDAYPGIAQGIRQGYIHDVSMGCFIKGTQVLTDSGYKNIENVESSDLLVDADGNLTKIINRQIKQETEKIFNIAVEGGISLTCTKEHPILAIKKDDWNKRVSRSHKNKPQRSFKDITPDMVDAQNLNKGDFVAVKIGGPIIESDLTIDKAKLLGYFAAEGNYLKYNGEVKEIEFSFSTDEKDTLVKDCITLIKSIFNVDARVYERLNKSIIVVRVTSSEIAEWFKYHIGEYSYGKNLSKELRFAEVEIQRNFIGTWLAGDGCIQHKKENTNGICGTTSSLNFAQDITYILTRLGIYHKIYARFESKTYCFTDALKIYSNSKGFDGRRMSFDIEIPANDALLIAPYTGFNIKSTVLSHKNHTGEYIVRQIKNITESSFNGPVYNFETESHTYTVSNIGVHNCSVEEGICSICGNKATTEKDYCDCLKQYKGKMHPSGKRAFEYNYGLKFIELSCVGDGAFENCEIQEIYDQDEILEKAKSIIKSAQALNSSVVLASAVHEDYVEKHSVELALRQLLSLNSNFIRIAQTAGTLVGGQIIGGGGIQNATVVKVLQGLGIDPSSNLNILDLVNLALNFLEVAVLNLFSRKDNIDLGHVAKLTKAMGELQNTLQDMIDDGVETSSAGGGAPMVAPQIPANGQQPAPQQPQQQVPQQPQQPVPQQAQQHLFQPSVGTMVSPFSQTPYAMPLGGGVSASTKDIKFVWASKTGNSEEFLEQTPKLSRLGRLAMAVDNLREACNISVITQNEENFDISQKNITVSSGEEDIMEHFKKIAQDLRTQKQSTVNVAIDINMDDNSGNRVVLSTDKGIKGFHNGRLTNWSPDLSEDQIRQMEGGNGYKVGADLLKDFSKVVKTAQSENKMDYLITLNESVEEDNDDVLVRTQSELHKEYQGQDGKTLQSKLDARRKNKVDSKVYEELINGERTSELVRIVTELSKDAQKGIGDKPLEEMIHPNFAHSTVPGKEIMSNVLNAVIKTCKKTSSKPEDVLNFLVKSSANSNFPKLLKLAKLGTPARNLENMMGRYAQIPPVPTDTAPAPDALGGETPMPDASMPESALTDVADTSTPETTEGDLMSAIKVIKDNFQDVADKLSEIIGEGPGMDKEQDMEDSLKGDDTGPDPDAMKGAVTGLSLAGEDTNASPESMVGQVNSMPTDNMARSIENARTPLASATRVNARNTRTASKPPLSENIIGWLADTANYYNISTEKMVLATKFFCSHKQAAIDTLKKSIRTSDVKVVDETIHTTTIMATLEEIGLDVKDAAFNSKFRDYAVDLLSRSGYEVDPTTFSLTDIEVSENGCVTGKVQSRAVKSFNPEKESEMEGMGDTGYIDSDRAMMGNPPMRAEFEIEAPVVSENPSMPETLMSDSIKSAKRLSRIQNVIKVAQGLGLPGAGGGAQAPAPGGFGAIPGAPADPTSGAPGMAGGAADLGVSSLTGGTEPAEPSIDESPEPGNKAPWGTVCPQCGSKDVDVANGEGKCNSCNAQLKYKFIVEVSPDDSGAEPEMPPMDETQPPAPAPEAPMTSPASMPTGGMGAAPAPGGGGMPAMASTGRVMTRISYRTTADVYANALSENFTKMSAAKLPVGMVCPNCGSRSASKQLKHSYCYDCGTISISNAERVEDEPGVLEATITWM